MSDSTFIRISHTQKQTKITLWSKDVAGLSDFPFDNKIFLEKVLPNIASAVCFSDKNIYSLGEKIIIQHLFQQKIFDGVRKANCNPNGRVTIRISKKDVNFFKKNRSSLLLPN